MKRIDKIVREYDKIKEELAKIKQEDVSYDVFNREDIDQFYKDFGLLIENLK